MKRKQEFKRPLIVVHMIDVDSPYMHSECDKDYIGQGITWAWKNVNCKKCLAHKAEEKDKARYLYKKTDKEQ